MTLCTEVRPRRGVALFRRQAKAIALTLVCSLLCCMTTLRADDLQNLEQQAFQQAAALISPSVVRIQTVGGADIVGKRLTGTAATTGVAVSADGFIVTSSYSFVGSPSAVLVELSTGEQLPAQIVATDHVLKLTLLKVDASDLLPIEAPAESAVEVGQWAIAIGRMYQSPSPSISVGVVSALNRVWGRAIQTDAKISPVNYGGPLINVKGQPLGLLVPLSPNAQTESAGVEWYDSGIGFAIPIQSVLRSVEQLKRGEDLHPGRMGIDFKKEGVGEPADIHRIWVGSPAFKAGFQIGDRITQVDDQPIRRQEDFRLAMGTRYAAETLKLTIKRGDESLTRDVTLVEKLLPYETPFLGILANRLPANDEMANDITVRYVFSNGPADQAELKPRDQITALNGQPLANVDALRSMLSQLRPADKIELELVRDGENISKTIELAQQPETVPDKVPSAPSHPAPGDDSGNIKSDVVRGEVRGTHDKLRYWGYVPTDDTDGRRLGLLVWLHPSGNGMEKDVLAAWKTICEQRGIVLLAPQTDGLAAWTASDVPVVEELVDEFIKTYAIDGHRIAAHGTGNGGQMAYNLAFKRRDLFRGVATLNALINTPPPQNLPDEQIDFFLMAEQEDAVFDRLQKNVAALSKLRHSAMFRAIPKTNGAYVSDDLVHELGRWLDVLDRI